MKILIVDDIEDNLYLLETLLKGSGYEVVTAKDGLEALGKLKEKPIDMIISDILMPRMDGFQLCRECKKDESLKKITFIFYTATYTDKEDEKFALSLGAERFIIKPQEPEIFLKILKEVIEKYKEGILIAPQEPIQAEEIYLSEYNKRLIKKLEKKILDLEKSKKQVKHLYSVPEVIRSVNQFPIREKNRNLLLQKICDILIKIRGYDSAWLGFLKDEKTFAIVVGSPDKASVSHFREQALGGDYPLCIKKVLTQKDLFLLINDYRECGDCRLKDIHGEEQSAIAIIRLEYNHQLLGLLAIILAPDVYTNKEEKELLEKLADDIAFGLHNIEIEEKYKLAEQKLQLSYQKIQKTMEDIIFTISEIIETRDPYNAGHQQRVSELAVTIAKELNLPQDKIEGIRIASLLHDIVKISVPAEILNKPLKLSEIEYSLIKDHFQKGCDILKSIEFPWPVVQIVLQHHERLNGSGYPQGLKGDEILLEARILGVADVIEAMSSDRPYRSAHSIEEALEEISKNKGILYDPEVVDVCITLFKEKGFEW
jgi:putative nucleotidyltransferase with HDIG domain